jgi:hypothetical protein
MKNKSSDILKQKYVAKFPNICSCHTDPQFIGSHYVVVDQAMNFINLAF